MHAGTGVQARHCLAGLMHTQRNEGGMMLPGSKSLHMPEWEDHLRWHTEQRVAWQDVHSFQAGRGCNPAGRDGAREAVAILPGVKESGTQDEAAMG